MRRRYVLNRESENLLSLLLLLQSQKVLAQGVLYDKEEKERNKGRDTININIVIERYREDKKKIEELESELEMLESEEQNETKND